MTLSGGKVESISVGYRHAFNAGSVEESVESVVHVRQGAVSVGMIAVGVQNYTYIGTEGQKAFAILARFGQEIGFTRTYEISVFYGIAADMSVKRQSRSKEYFRKHTRHGGFAVRSAHGYRVTEKRTYFRKKNLSFQAGNVFRSQKGKFRAVGLYGTAVYGYIGRKILFRRGL